MATAPRPRTAKPTLSRVARATAAKPRSLLNPSLDFVRNRPLADLFETWATSCPIGLFIVQDGAFAWVNPQFQRDTGYSLDELVDTAPEALVHANDCEAVRNQAITMLRGVSQTPYSFRFITKQGDVRWVLATVVSVSFNGRRAQLGSFMDITARKQLEEQLTHQAFHDALTQLPNRALFLDRLAQLLTRRSPLGVEVATLYIDIDDLKRINDRWGHHAGDALLVAAGERLRKALRPADTAARFGGDEFTVLLADITAPTQALQIAERLLVTLRQPYIIGGHEVQATASIGLALGTPGQTPAMELLQAADVALYRAKARGKDCVEQAPVLTLIAAQPEQKASSE